LANLVDDASKPERPQTSRPAEQRMNGALGDKAVETIEPGSDAFVAATRIIAARLAAREWICRTLTTLQHLRVNASILAVRAVDDLSRDEFVNEYYSTNKPVVLKGIAGDWPALRLWTPAYLKAVCGGEDVEIMMNRDTVGPADQSVSDRIRTQIKFGEYLDLVYNGGSTNDYYMVARNNFFASDASRQLLRDITWPAPIIQPDPECNYTRMWFGPAGTVTSLHHDGRNNLVVQVSGRKRFRLYSPLCAEYLYQREAFYSAVDCEDPDTTRFPSFHKAAGTVTELEPGDGLFVPVGWWHHVRALEPSMTLTFANFGLCNDFPYSRTWGSCV
jgi:hypothetical protein